jgi:hypothetical protein
VARGPNAPTIRFWRLLPLCALAVTVLAVTVLAACGSGGSGGPVSPPAAPRTRQVDVSPVTTAGAPVAGYRVTSTAEHAQCSEGSEAIGQAYRCFAGNAVYDPCWAEKATAPTVLCVADPWLRTAARLRVSSPLGPIPAEGGAGPAEPWGVQLAGGQRCTLAQGAHGVFHGTVVDYYCTPELSLLRGIGRAGATWTVRSVLDKSGQLSAGPTEKIAIAWYGRPDLVR